jgi:hypothetical protein
MDEWIDDAKFSSVNHRNVLRPILYNKIHSANYIHCERWVITLHLININILDKLSIKFLE